jgi:transcriptional regulator with XRE-family HTH domain
MTNTEFWWPLQCNAMQGKDRFVTLSDETPGKAFARAVGEELRRVREGRGWSRAQFVALLPSKIGERTLLSYEHGTRQLTALRLVELCQELGVETPRMLGQALQRARLYLQNIPLHVDLNALLQASCDGGRFRLMAQWARNALSEHPNGIMEVGSTVVRNLALFIGCDHGDLATYLARFIPDDIDEPDMTGPMLRPLPRAP